MTPASHHTPAHLVYVDTEHGRVREDPEAGSRHRARVVAARERLAEAGEARCAVIGFAEATPATIAQLRPAAIVIGGNTTDWADFDFREMAGLLAVIRAAPAPILGICAGHQLVGFAHGARWGPLGPLQAGEADPDPSFAPGQRKERGFLPIAIDARCPLFRGLASATVFQSHYWQLEEAPSGFVARAGSAWSPIQAIERQDGRVFGVQFHPERHDSAHPDGAAILRNFMILAKEQASEG